MKLESVKSLEIGEHDGERTGAGVVEMNGHLLLSALADVHARTTRVQRY